jgi:hypothetical protein
MTPIIECRFCRERYDAPPEEVGARCRNCRMPLFERPPRRRPGYDLGPCAVHPDVEAYGKCRSCGKLMCQVCRTRWYDQLVCPACLTGMLEGSEANPREQKLQSRTAGWSAMLSFAAWLMLICALIPLGVMYGREASPALRTFAAILFFGSLIPAAFAVGQAMSVIRWRSERLNLAVASLTCASVEIGLVVGILVLNLWYN